PRPAASDPRHRAHSSRLERREARALSRPAPGKRVAVDGDADLIHRGVHRPHRSESQEQEEIIAMHETRSGPSKIFTAPAATASLVAACNSSTSPSPSASGAATQPSATTQPSAAAPTPLVTAQPIAQGAPGPNGGVVIRWFVGLGTGAKPEAIATEQTVV